MNTRRLSLLFALTLALGPACGTHEHDHDDHAHGDAHAHDDGRSHGAGHPDDGGHEHAAEYLERPTVAITHWTDRSELFMEYPAFVAGERGRAAIHVTDIEDFSPLEAGEVTVALRSSDGRSLEFRGGPSRPGIFGVDLAADAPGVYQMDVRVDAPDWDDVHELGSVTVYRSGELPDAPPGEEGGISFLKEQQWTLAFGTARADVRALRASVSVPATIRPRAGGDALLAAPVAGRIDPVTVVAVPNTRVRAGTVLVRIVPGLDDALDKSGLHAALTEAEQRYDLAEIERARVARLVDARALPARRLAEAEVALATATVQRAAARDRWRRFETLSDMDDAGERDGSFAIRAPFDGVVTEIRFTPGASVGAHDALLRVVDVEHPHVVGLLPESSAVDAQNVVAGEILLDGAPPIALGKPLSIGRLVDPSTRATEVRFAVEDVASQFRIGEGVRLRLFIGPELKTTSVPESSIVDDGGLPVIFVQTGGESFARRAVTLGIRAGGWVQVVSGVEPGERVVDRGAYLIRLAAMSTQIPIHGHVH